MACPAPHRHDGVHDELQETAAHASPPTWRRAPGPTTKSGSTASRCTAAEQRRPHDVEPLYGKVYLPRKFKTGLALPEDNCIDVYAQDLGLLAIVENGAIVGYNVLVGGGMGMTHGNANTFPHLAKPICYVPADGGGRRGRGGGQAVPRSRQPRRPQARPHQVPGPRLGRREVPRGAGRTTSAAAARCRGRSR